MKAGSSGLPSLKNPIEGVIPGPQVWEACFTGKYRNVGDWYSGKGAQAGVDETCDIHCIIHDENAYLQTGPNMKRGIEAHRKMDFVLSKAQFLTTQALYSDIVLPVTTQWEVPGGLASSNREFLYCFSQVTEPLYEAKTDAQINALIMEALGLDPSTVYPISEKQAFFNQIAGATVIKEDGSGKYEPLVTITDADLKEWGVSGKPQTGRVGLQLVHRLCRLHQRPRRQPAEDQERQAGDHLPGQGRPVQQHRPHRPGVPALSRVPRAHRGL